MATHGVGLGQVSMDPVTPEKAVRFPVWVGLAIFSAVCVAAISTETTKSTRGSDAKWSLAVSVISMLAAFFSSLAYLFGRGMFRGQLPEGFMVLLVVGFWGFGLPVMMNPEKGIAATFGKDLKTEVEIVNANLYFFAWASFACCVFLTLSVAQEVMGVAVSKTPPKVVKWFSLTAFNLVVMGASARIYRIGACFKGEEDHDTSFCRRTVFAISAGTIGFVMSAVMVLISSRVSPLIVNVIVSSLLFGLWTFGVGYITFGAGPGHTIGNLYFSTWGSFVFSVILFSESLEEFSGGGSDVTQHPTAPQSEQPSMQVIDEDI